MLYWGLTRFHSTSSFSILTLHRRLLHLRRDHAALAFGGYRTVPLPPELSTEVYCYERFEGDAAMRIVLNFGAAEQRVPFPVGTRWTVMLSSRSGRTGAQESGELTVGPNEGLILAPQAA